MTRLWIGMVAILSLVLVACGDDDAVDNAVDNAGSGGTTSVAESPAADVADEEQPDEVSPGGSGPSSGTLVVGGETLTVASVRCFLEEQPRVGRGVFEFTAQARATNAAGEDVRLDVSRVRPESGPTEDNIDMDIGPLRDSVSYRAGGPEAVSLDGQMLTAEDVTLTGGQPAESLNVSFELTCGS